MRPTRALPLLLLVATVAVAAAPRRAEACDPALPRIRAWQPVADQANVPTNTLLWLSGVVGEVTLKTGAQTIATTQMQVAAHLQAVQLRPSQPLLPNTRYTVSATGPYDTQAVTYSFTTGAAAEQAIPPAPPAIRVTAEPTRATDGASCVSHPAGYNLTIEAEPVAGAVLYELLQLGEEGGYELLLTDSEPRFFVFTQSLPSPQYAIRPVSLSGQGPAASATPTGHAPGEDGGCSAAGTTSSSLSWLMAALASGGLLRRRRRN